MERTDAGAIFSLVAELILAFVDEQPQPLCLHCGAVECDGQLIVFPNTEQAGKSTLLAQLASDNQRVFADDALPLSAKGTRGMALGIAPRLRLPLPASASSAFRAFVEVHRGLSDHESLYLALPPGLLAPYGTTASIGAVVLLDRKMSGTPRLEPTPRENGLQHLIIQNFARAGTSLASVDVLHALMRRVPCFTLAYSDLQDAAKVFLDRFAVPHESELMIGVTSVDSRR